MTNKERVKQVSEVAKMILDAVDNGMSYAEAYLISSNILIHEGLHDVVDELADKIGQLSIEIHDKYVGND
jgi:hypothetical protein